MTGAELSLIVTNARIRTGDPLQPWATALAVREGKLAVVGAAAEILKMAGTDTRIVDAAGQQLELPPGMAIGSAVTIAIAPENRITLGSREA